MILVGVIIFLVLVALLVAGIATLATRQKKGTLLQALDQHARYTAKAARASRRGKEGEMNVWSEAAADLWVQLEKLEAPKNRQLSVPPDATVDVRAARDLYRSQIPAHLLERSARRRQQLERGS